MTKLSILSLALCAAASVNTSTSFVFPSSTSAIQGSTVSRSRVTSSSRLTTMVLSDKETSKEVETKRGGSQSQAEIEATRLRAMAAQLRSEAAALEEEQSAFRSQESERIFKTFDSDRNGFIDVNEMKEGLENLLKKTVSPERAAQLLQKLDLNSDGVISPKEMVTAQKLRLRLDEIAREEAEAYRQSRETAQQAKDMAELEKARSDLINDEPPSGSDCVVSALPYILPLSDSLLFGSFLLQGQIENPNPAVILLLATTALIRAIPFGQFAAFFGLSVLGDNLKVNKLVRHNALQAIYLDVALFPASLLTAAAAYGKLPQEIIQAGSSAVFIGLLAAVLYSIGSSALGNTPDKIPFISGVVQRRIDRMSAREFFIRNMEDELNKQQEKEKKDKDNKDRKD